MRTWLTCTLATLTLLGVGVGAGLGVGLRHNEISFGSTPTAPTVPRGSTTVGSAVPTSTLKPAAINDTSLGAVTTLDGNRHIFYQDSSGSLRHIVYDASARAWSNEADLVLTESLPRNNTPVTAINAEFNLKNQIHVFFIDMNDRVAATAYVSGGFVSASDNLMNGSLSAATGSRTLSISRMTLSQTYTADEALLFYEANNGGNFTSLRGYLNPGVDPPWIWYDVSEIIYGTFASWASIPDAVPNTLPQFGSPLGSDCILQPFGQQVTIAFFNPASISNNTGSLWLLEFSNWTALSKSACVLLHLMKPSRPKYWH